MTDYPVLMGFEREREPRHHALFVGNVGRIDMQTCGLRKIRVHFYIGRSAHTLCACDQ
jgi:hypothetical protein